MSRWKDLGTILPEDDSPVMFRRYPEATPIIFGIISIDDQLAFCGPDDWPMPWHCVTHWSLPSGDPPLWPAPQPAGKAWRDIFWTPPQDEQFCWVRRYDTDCAAIITQWNLASFRFELGGTPLTLPWWAVWKWKPTS